MSRRVRPSTANPDAELLRRTAHRIGLQAGMLVGLAVLVLAGLATVVVLHQQHASAMSLLRQTAANADDVTDPPAGTWLVIRDAGAERQSPGLPAPLPDDRAIDRVSRTGRPVLADVHEGDREFRILTRSQPRGTVQVALDMGPQHAERARLLLALGASGTVGLALAAVVGAVLGHRAVAPLARALSLQRGFVADASHELRTPLTLLSTRAQMLQRGLLSRGADPTTLRDAEGVVTDTSRLVEVVDDLLLAAETGQDAPTDLLDVGALCGDVVDSARDFARSQRVGLVHAGVSTEPPVIVNGNTAALRRALLAVLDNAVAHTPAEGRVTLTAHRRGGEAVVDVSDTGTGISATDLDHVFDRFHSSSQRAGRRRYGLGLALARDVMARHDGEITVALTTPSGTTVRLTLPVADKPTQ